MSQLLLGLDIGTSSVKAAAFDLQGNGVAASHVPLRVDIPQPGWAEQDPQQYWHATVSALSQLARQVDPRRVRALGLTGQCPTHVLIDEKGQPLGPAIIWSDGRSQEEAAWLAARITPQQAEEWTGSPLIADAHLSPARLLWLKAHRPTDWAKTTRVTQPKDFVALRLTGVCATDTKSAFCLLNPQTESYPPQLFQALGIPLELMPPALRPTDVVGTLTHQAATTTGFPHGIPVVSGTIDGWCDTLAGGGALPGGAVDVAGTSEIVCLGTDSTAQVQGVFLAELSPENRFLCAPMKAGGGTLRWLAQAVYRHPEVEPDFGLLEAEASSVPAGSAGLIFLPYLDGERSPVWDPTARGAFAGLSLTHHRGHLTRAVYEGIAFAVRQVLEMCEQASGQSVQRLVACGGGSRSAFWNQVKANILQRSIVPTVVREGGCLGAAMLAAVGTRCYASISEACLAMQRLAQPVEPDPLTSEVYQELYAVYRSLYPALRPLYTARNTLPDRD